MPKNHAPDFDVHPSGDDPGHLVVSGSIDMATAPRFREALAHASDAGGDLVIDVRGVEFIDSTGIGALVAAARRSRLEGVRIELVGPSAQFRNVLEITNLTTLFDIV